MLIILLVNTCFALDSYAMESKPNKKVCLPDIDELLLEHKSYVPQYEPADPNLNAYLMERQSWKSLTRHYMQMHPENTNVQKLHRYLIVASMEARKKMPQDQSMSLVELVKQDPDAIMHGAAEQDYIDTGKINHFLYHMYGIDEFSWKSNYLPVIEEQIARCASEKQKLPGHACVQ